jgi:hypothetical protein
MRVPLSRKVGHSVCVDERDATSQHEIPTVSIVVHNSRDKMVSWLSHSEPKSIGIFVKFPCIEGLLMELSRFTDLDLYNTS